MNLKTQNTGAKTRKQIAEEYRICRKTLSRWLKKEAITTSNRLITPKGQEIIYEKFGKPKNVP